MFSLFGYLNHFINLAIMKATEIEKSPLKKKKKQKCHTTKPPFIKDKLTVTNLNFSTFNILVIRGQIIHLSFSDIVNVK